MPPVPPNTTGRLRVHYTGPYGTHTALFHAITGTSEPDLIASVQDYVTAAAVAQYNGTVWDTAEFCVAGSTIFNPASGWTPITSTSGISPSANNDPARFVQWGGRASVSGVRVKLYVFEEYIDTVPAMKYLAGVNATLDAVTAVLQDVANLIGCIDGFAPVWKTYVNVNSNDHLVHRARR